VPRNCRRYRVERRLSTEIGNAEKRLVTWIYQVQLQAIGVMTSMLGLLFALIKLV
jgi:hypothetical protein